MTDDSDLRNDPEIEGRVSTWLTSTDLTPDEASAGLDRLLHEFPVTPQARRRFLGRWLDRDEGVGRHAVDHDPPPKTNRRNRLMLSATGITAALAILAISANVIDSDPVVPGQAGATHVVASDGSGDFSTIQEAVDEAADGDTIAIRPGTYTESVTIDKDLTVAGEGLREDTVVVIPKDGPSLDPDGRQLSYAFQLLEADTSLGNLTIKGSGHATIAVLAEGGRTVLHELAVELEELQVSPRVFAVVGDGTEAVVRDNESNAELVVAEDAVATVTGNVTTGPDKTNGLVVWVGSGSDVELTGNLLNGVVIEGGSGRLVQNELFAPDGCALVITGREAVVTASKNLIHTSDSGICTSGAATAMIEDNEIVDNVTGISLGSDVSVMGNELHNNDVAILFRVGSSTVEDNNVTGNRAGLAFGSLPSTPLVSGNSFCANEVMVEAPDDVVLPSLEDNEVC